jgi:hypothetical protein
MIFIFRSRSHHAQHPIILNSLYPLCYTQNTFFFQNLSKLDCFINFYCACWHRWALSPISVMSYIGLSLYRTVRYRTERLKICRIFRYRTKVFSDIRYPTSKILAAVVYYSTILTGSCISAYVHLWVFVSASHSSQLTKFYTRWSVVRNSPTVGSGRRS